jgi:hypothetical protein
VGEAATIYVSVHLMMISFWNRTCKLSFGTLSSVHIIPKRTVSNLCRIKRSMKFNLPSKCFEDERLINTHTAVLAVCILLC